MTFILKHEGKIVHKSKSLRLALTIDRMFSSYGYNTTMFWEV